MPDQRFTNVSDWCARQPAMIAALSVCLVYTARQAGRLLHMVTASQHGAALSMHRDLGRWLACYRRHRQVAGDVTHLVVMDPGMAQALGQLQTLMTEFQALPDDVGIHDPTVEACGQRLLQAFFTLDAAPDTPATSQDLQDPSFVGVWFHLSVWMPCMLLARALPAHLLRRARHGDWVALGQLVMFDRNVLFDPRIQRLVHDDPQGWQRVLAVTGKRPRPIGSSTWKVMAGATLRSLGDACAHPIPHRDIAGLFHAFAQDVDGAPDDADISLLGARSFERMVTATLRQGHALLGLGQHPATA